MASAPYELERILSEARSIVTNFSDGARNSADFGLAMALEQQDLLNPRDAQKNTGVGEQGRVIARDLRDVPVVDQPPPPPDYDIDNFFNQQLFDQIPQFYDLVKEQRDEYIAEFFPGMLDKLTGMADWLQDVMENGYSGLPAHIEDGIWNRDRARVDLAYRAGADELFADHAGRGFPLPSGPLVANLDKQNDDRTNASAVASREAAIKQAELAIETVKFAVKTSADLFIGLHKVVDDVIKNGTAIILGAMDNSDKMIRATVALYGMTIAYYGALESWHSLQMSHDIPQGSLDLKADEINLKADLDVIEKIIAAAGHKASVTANMTSSALGSLQTITTISDETTRDGTDNN